MRRAVVAGVIAAGVLAPPAHACTQLPAPSATEVAARHQLLRVCVKGRRVVLARHARIRGASAAGHRVAWIEVRRRRTIQTLVVTEARVGRRVRMLRRFTADRRRTPAVTQADVLLTRQGDLAWSAGAYGEYDGVIAVAQPGRPTRRLSRYSASHLALEDGRTLRWDDGDFDLGFFDLRHRHCPSRALYAELGRDDRAIVTQHFYGDSYDEGITVVRGCDPSTGRDRVIFENYSDISYESDLSLLGLDGRWAVFLQAVAERDGNTDTLSVVDARTGGQLSADVYEDFGVNYPVPSAAAGFAVTRRGALGWLGEGALYALVADGRIVQLDAGGTLAGLHAEGDELVWTHAGLPRRVVVTPG